MSFVARSDADTAARIASPESVADQGAVSRFAWAIRDGLLMVKRNLLHIPRTPELLLDSTIQPVIFVLLFRYVFGGAIAVQGTSYVNYLMAGIFVQTLVFAAVTSGIGIANDLSKGLIDRFRSLPMSPSAVVTGRTFTDLLRGMLAVSIMFLVGMLVGFRPTGDVGHWAIGFGLLLLFGYAFAWIGVTIGTLMRTPEAVQGVMFVAIFPFTFASSAFVPTDTMPRYLRLFAENQPVSHVVNALRSSVLGQPIGGDGWWALGWSLLFLVIFVPLSVSLYQKRTTD